MNMMHCLASPYWPRKHQFKFYGRGLFGNLVFTCRNCQGAARIQPKHFWGRMGYGTQAPPGQGG